ncbi:MAG TPA: hypothetical protein VF148_11870 [Acidimicrobiia bacterium]
MAHRWTVWVLLLAGLLLRSDIGDAHLAPVETSQAASPVVPLASHQQALVDFALERFETQGLQLPDLEFVFRDSLLPCDLHKGRYHRDRQLVEMCSMDKHTMLHELAHAWANEHMTPEHMESFVASNGLDSWNDADHSWARRGTEHVAETIAWALSDEPRHVKWVEYREDGTDETTYKILTIGVDVEVLITNFKTITGLEPLYRHAAEWPEQRPVTASPELQRLGS